MLSFLIEAFYRTINERTPLMGSVEDEDAHSHTGADLYYSPEGSFVLKLVYTYRRSRRFFAPFKNGFNVVVWCCLHIALQRSKVPRTKTVMVMATVNEALWVREGFIFLVAPPLPSGTTYLVTMVSVWM